MHATSSAVVLALALTCAARPALPQEARACANEVQRLSEGLPLVHAEGREEAPSRRSLTLAKGPHFRTSGGSRSRTLSGRPARPGSRATVRGA